MKVGEGQNAPVPPAKQAFKLKLSIPATRAAAQAKATAGKLVEARQSMAANSSRLVGQRQEMRLEQKGQIDGRAIDLIIREFSEAFDHEPHLNAPRWTALSEPSPAPRDLPPPSPSPAPSAQRRAESVAALIEHIEVLVRSQRPTLALTLNNSFAARVEVEKTGPMQVALKIQGWNGPPPPAELARIREAIAQRGLKLTSLSIA